MFRLPARRKVLNIPDQHGHDHIADICRPAADMGGDDDIGLCK